MGYVGCGSIGQFPSDTFLSQFVLEFSFEDIPTVLAQSTYMAMLSRFVAVLTLFCTNVLAKSGKKCMKSVKIERV